MDNIIKTSEDAQNILGVSTLSVVSRINSVRQAPDALVAALAPRSLIAEAFRSLRINLRFAGLENPEGALMVTSAGPGEGKSTMVANLGVIMSQAGKRVVLIESDLRRPSQHKIFDLPNDTGLSDMFLENPPELDDLLKPTKYPGLRVLTSGRIPPNPGEILDSKKMGHIIEGLRWVSDMVLFDSPPVLAVSDASIIGSKCSSCVLVVDAGHTRKEMVEKAGDALHKANIHLFGVVLNPQTERKSSGSYSYYYYSSADKEDKKKKVKQKPA